MHRRCLGLMLTRPKSGQNLSCDKEAGICDNQIFGLEYDHALLREAAAVV